jgi:hypothetical protein
VRPAFRAAPPLSKVWNNSLWPMPYIGARSAFALNHKVRQRLKKLLAPKQTG